MNRRSFLQGTFGGVTSAGVLVLAGQAEIEAFARPLRPDVPLLVDGPSPTAAPVAGMHLYTAGGELVAVVREVRVFRGAIDVTGWADEAHRFIPGAWPTTEILADGIGAPEALFGSRARKG